LCTLSHAFLACNRPCKLYVQRRGRGDKTIVRIGGLFWVLGRFRAEGDYEGKGP
jgi:hypothetical protein